MLFKINMYRMGREKRLAAQTRIRRFAAIATLIAVNVVVVGLFVIAVLLSGRGIEAKEPVLCEPQHQRGSRRPRRRSRA